MRSVGALRASLKIVLTLYDRLRAVSVQLGITLRATSAVGGPAATLLDYESIVAERLPLIISVPCAPR